MKQVPTPEHFETLLGQLGSNREEAGIRYEQLRQRLLCIFTNRHCPDPEELVDETLDRVARKLAEDPVLRGMVDPSRFVYGVAWNVVKESFKRARMVPLPEGWDPAAKVAPEDVEVEHACLDQCLASLATRERELVASYFTEERQAKIRHRALLAQEEGGSLNALRLKVHRIVCRLRECVMKCLARQRLDYAGGHEV